MQFNQPDIQAKCLSDHVEWSVFLGMLNAGIGIVRKRIDIVSSRNEIESLLMRTYPMLSVLQDSDRDMYFSNMLELFISVKSSDHMIQIDIRGSKDSVDSASVVFSQFGSSVYVRWIYDAEYMESMNVAVPSKNLPFTEMYPFLNGERLHQYYDRFMDSDASILLLIGPPGGGKTSFLRGLMHHTKQNAILTYNSKLLEKDEFFAEWFRSEKENLVIIEDADTLLVPRSDGNSMMQRFLNLGDGLLTFKGKKMIFTTNLPSVASIDDALMRPGRCHDILKFSALCYDDVKTVCNISGVNPPKEEKSYMIAEIFSDTKTRKSIPGQNKFGFC